MRSRNVPLLLVLVLVAAALAGCGKSNPASPTAPTGDAGQVSGTLGASLPLVDDGLTESTAIVGADLTPAPAGGAALLAAVRPFEWWQTVSAISTTWDFAFADTDSTGRPATCVATEHKHLVGSLVIVPRSPSDSTVADTSRIVKPLDKTLTRRILLKRILLAGARQWKVVAVTGAFVASPGNTTHIVSLRLQSTSGVDTTISDPLQWHSLRHVVQFSASDSVTLTVTTNHTDDAVFIHRWDWRHRMRSNGDGTYTFGWTTTSWPGWRWFGVQALSHASLYDDTASVDTEAWHEPFRIAGLQAAVDYYPQ